MLTNPIFIIIIIVIIAIISSGILFYFKYSSDVDRLANEVAVKEIRSISLIQAHDLGKIIENSLIDIVTNLQTISNSPAVQTWDIRDMESLINVGQTSTEEITNFYGIISKEGKLIAGSNLDEDQYTNIRNLDFSTRSYFTIPKQTQKIYFSNMSESPDKISRFYIAQPILVNESNKNKQGQIFSNDSSKSRSTIKNNIIDNNRNINNSNQNQIFEGVIFASVKVERLKLLIEDLTILSPAKNNITLVDRERKILIDPNKNLIGENIFGDKVQSLFSKTVFSKELPVINKLYKEAMKGKIGIYDFHTKNQTHILSYMPISIGGKQIMTLFITKPHMLDGQVIHFLDLQRAFSISVISVIVIISSFLSYYLITWNKRLQKKVNDQTLQLNQNIEQLQNMNDKLLENEKIQKEFINVAAHELRTPTQSIVGYIEMVRNFPDNFKKYLEPLERNSQRLFRLTEDILDIARIESNNLKLNKEIFDINSLIVEIINDFIIKHKNINKNDFQVVSINEDGFEKLENKETTLFIKADKDRIQQVLLNLVTNAYKFTENGKITALLI